ncbi:hypothetical protein ACFZBU_39820 [Embleya sp. NPDC008237]
MNNGVQDYRTAQAREAVGIDDRTVHPHAEHDGDEGMFVDPADAQATTP